MYLVLASVFFLTLGFSIILVFSFNFRKHRIWKKMAKAYLAWMTLYFLFIMLGTGSSSPRLLPATISPYKLPWAHGVSRFVSQGNRSFTSHRGNSLFAWDFWMSVGTEILASRSGTVIKIEQSFDGIGLHSNFIVIEHADKTHALYAHIKKNGCTVKLGEKISQGQVWRLFTPCLMHRDFLHILFNMVWVWLLAKQVEERMRKFKMLWQF
jgi:murein DD-endopeptidase MepM/ murein hydrolase activator NlpD